MNSLLTPKQVARLLRISYHKVLELILMGDLPAYRLGGAYRVAEGDLKAYLESNKFKSQFPR